MVELTAQEAVSRVREDEFRLGLIDQQLRALAQLLDEVRVTRVTLEELPRKAAESLVPFHGVFVPAKVGGDSVGIDVGAGVVVEKTVDEAIDFLKKREKLLGDNVSQLQVSAQRIAAEMAEIQAKLNEFVQARQNQPAG
jgi:prefoldin alpha subunit